MKVLITGARAPIALDLARIFHRAQHRVYMADSTRYPLSKKSNCIAEYITLPSPRLQPTQFVNSLKQALKEFQIDMLIPTCEEIFYISQFRNQFPSDLIVFCDNFIKLKWLHNKYTFIQSCSNQPIYTPKTYLIDEHLSLDDLEDIRYVIKPVYSRFATQVILNASKKQILELKKSKPNQYIAQEFIGGAEYSTYGVALNGKLTANVCYHSLYRAGKGAGILFHNVYIPEIFNFITEYVKENNFTGQIAFDFIQDRKGNVYVIECNPRGTSGLHFFKHEKHFSNAFIDPMVLLIPDMLRYKALKLAVYCFALPKIRNLSGLRNLIKHLNLCQDIIYDKEDKIPAFYQFYSLMVIFIKSLAAFKSPLTISTCDIEYDG